MPDSKRELVWHDDKRWFGALGQAVVISPLPNINWGASGCPRFIKGRGPTIKTPTCNQERTGKALIVRLEALYVEDKQKR